MPVPTRPRKSKNFLDVMVDGNFIPFSVSPHFCKDHPQNQLFRSLKRTHWFCPNRDHLEFVPHP